MLSSAQLKEAFDGFDKDQSGTLNYEEIVKLAATLGAKTSKSELEVLFKDIDVNKDGNLSFEEFLAWYRVGKMGKLASTLKLQMDLLSRSKKFAAKAKESNSIPSG